MKLISQIQGERVCPKTKSLTLTLKMRLLGSTCCRDEQKGGKKGTSCD